MQHRRQCKDAGSVSLGYAEGGFDGVREAKVAAIAAWGRSDETKVPRKGRFIWNSSPGQWPCRANVEPPGDALDLGSSAPKCRPQIR